LAAASIAAAASAWAQETRYFRIGTAATSGTYYPVGGLIAGAISNPPGSRPCDKGGSCGVPGLIAVAQSTQGSVHNVELISRGQLEAGLSQSDIAYWAQTGTGTFAQRGRIEELRAVANLYAEHIHLVVPWDSSITKVAELRGKRVSLGELSSGTLVDAKLILAAHGLGEADLDPVYVTPDLASDDMIAGKLDAFFLIAGAPAPAIAELASQRDIRLIPVEGPEVDKLLADAKFFSRAAIPAGVYNGVDATPTLAVSAQLVVSARLPEELVHGMARAIWHPATRALLDSGHPQGRNIRIETALDGLAIPLHPGAERFYKEIGRIK
jgi:TRAP transporter TAXI family solute receptor